MAATAASPAAPRVLARPRLAARASLAGAWVYVAVVAVHLLAGLLVVQMNGASPLSTLGVYLDDAVRIAHGQVPYRDFTLEYPPLSIPFLVLPLLGGQSLDAYRSLFTQEIMLTDLLGAVVTVWAIRRFRLTGALWAVVVAQPLWLMMADRSVVFERYDLIPGVACLIAVVLLAARQDRWAWIALGVAIALKLYPAVLGPIFLAAVWQRRPRRELVLDLAACAAAVVLPSVAAVRGDVPALWSFVTYHLDRGLEVESSWANLLLLLHLHGLLIIHVHGAGSEEVVASSSALMAAASLPLTVLALLAVYAAAWRMLKRPLNEAGQLARLARLSIAAILVFMLIGKVLSPQYLLWLFPLVPLIGGTWLTCSVVLGGALLLSRWIYPDHWQELVTFQTREIVILTLRNALLVGLLVLSLSPRSEDRWRLVRSWRASGSRDAVAALGAAAVLVLCLVDLGWMQQWLPVWAAAANQAPLVKTYLPGHAYFVTRAPQLPAIAPGVEAALPQVGQVTATLGGTGGRLDDARALGVSPSGIVYVLESSSKQVVAFDAQGQRTGFALSGIPANQALGEPADLAVDAQGRLDVLDSDRSAIDQFGPDGTFQRSLPLQQYLVYHPRGLAIGPQGDLYVADTGGSRALQLTSSGTLLHEWDNQHGYDLDQPTGIAADAAGNVYVAEPADGRLDKIGPDGTVVAVRHIAPTGTVLGPHIAVTPSGQIAVTDPAQHNVALFNSDLTEVGTLGQRPTGFQQPVGITALADGSYWIADPAAGLVVRVSP